MPTKRTSTRAPSERVADEKPIPLFEMAEQLTFCNSDRTLRSWTLVGCLNPFTKKRVYLEFTILPVGAGTSMPAVRRFLTALNEQPKPQKKTRRKA